MYLMTCEYCQIEGACESEIREIRRWISSDVGRYETLPDRIKTNVICDRNLFSVFLSLKRRDKRQCVGKGRSYYIL